MAEKTHQSPAVLIGTVALLGSLIGSYFLFPEYRQFIDEAYEVFSSGEKERISSWVKQFGHWGPICIVLATIVQMFLIAINVVLLVTIAIVVYGPFWGSSLAILSIGIASAIGYLIGRHIGSYTIERLIGQETEETVKEYTERYGYFAVVIARISPLLSNDAISFVAGLVKMNFFKFILATFAGIVPLTALIAWLAEDMERLKQGLIWVTAVSLVLLAAYIFYDKKVRSRNTET